MSDRRRQWWLLGGAVGAIAIAMWLQGGGEQTPAAATSTPARARRPAAGQQGSGGPPQQVELAALSSNREGPPDADRNPFRYRPRVVAPPPRPSGPAVPVAPPVSAPAVPAGPPPAPPIQLKFIGLVEKADGVKVAVLTDGRVTLHGIEGDIIDGRYRIVKIGVESIELTYADGRGRQTIRLTGQ